MYLYLIKVTEYVNEVDKMLADNENMFDNFYILFYDFH